MSVIVKGMQMPSECRKCFAIDYDTMTGETYCKRNGKTLAESYRPIGFDGRPEWCQLVELPEKHGRLIDADYVVEKIRHELGIKDISFLYNAEKSVVNQIFHAPTILKAEGVDE